MAGSLIKVNTATVSGTPSTLKVTGIDSTYDVYVLVAKNLIPSSDDTIGWRVTKGESIQSDSEYDNARQDMPSAASYQDNEAQNADGVTNADIESTGNGFFATFYLFNFNNSSEYSYGTFEHAAFVSTPQVFGGAGGFVHTVASASDGLSFYFTGGATFASGGELVLYGLKK
tara:strand:+ start:1422 stop:1937 length:516 start_codon:yes stop_codon:yes gene_type:complete